MNFLDNYSLQTPVMFVIFNRLNVTKQSFENIRRVKPKKLYIVSDGARPDKKGEDERVDTVRKYVEEHIDWDCQVNKDYALENYGCRKRISSGVSWVLSQEEEVIVIEDDIVATSDFYKYCQEMLEHYRNNEKIMMISGTNTIEGHIKGPYTFSCFSSCWGWATWRRAWKYYDDTMEEWPELKKRNSLKYVMPGPSYLFLKWNFNYVYNKEMSSWAFVWDYSRFKEHGLGIVPKENLIRNIGFEQEEATHTSGKCKYKFEYGSYLFPLEKIDKVERNMEYDKAYINQEYPGWKALLIWLKKAFLYIPRRIVKMLSGVSK